MKELSIAPNEGDLIEYYIAETAGKKSKLVREKVKPPRRRENTT